MTESNTHQTSLLEWLRRQDCGMIDAFGSEREKTEKILRHREEFPSKLRDAIDLAGIGEEITNALSSERGFEPLSEPLSDRAFLSEVYRAVRDFVFILFFLRACTNFVYPLVHFSFYFVLVFTFIADIQRIRLI